MQESFDGLIVIIAYKKKIEEKGLGLQTTKVLSVVLRIPREATLFVAVVVPIG